MPQQQMRPSSAGSIPLSYGNSAGQTPPESEANAISLRTTPGTRRRAALLGPINLRCAAGTYIARSGVGFEDWAAQHFLSIGVIPSLPGPAWPAEDNAPRRS